MDTLVNNLEDPGNTLLRESAIKELSYLQANRIDYLTFSAKIKIQYQDKNGPQPEGNAVLRLYKDSAIWVSLSGSILNLEAFRVLITPDSVILLNKLDKIVEKHPFRYMEELANMPLNFSTLQDLIVGNPIYLGDSIIGFQPSDKQILLATTGKLFTNLLSLSPGSHQLQSSNLEEIGGEKKRTIHLFYEGYQTGAGVAFSTIREIIVNDDSQLKMAMTLRQYEFNKELSVSMNIPSNYKTK